MKKLFTCFFVCIITISITSAQNIGIGTATPLSPLHLRGTGALLRLDAPAPSISFYNNTSQYGSIFFNQADGSMNFFTPLISGGSVRISPNNNLNTIFTNTGNVGIGLVNPSYKLDVNGDINLTGALRANGATGTARQVLTSNGATGAPEWKNAAYSNNIRFAVEMSAIHTTPGTSITGLTFGAVQYNLSPADVSISTTNITINKAGLYHFEGFLHNRINFSSTVPNPSVTVGITAGSFSFDMVRDQTMNSFLGSGTYAFTVRFNVDIYIPAPGIVDIRRVFALTTSGTGALYESSSSTGIFTGYLISE